MTGLDGTPMPSFADNIKPEEAWDLVFYLRTLMCSAQQRKRDGEETGPEAGGSECPGGTAIGLRRHRNHVHFCSS